MDPFMGGGSGIVVADRLKRKWIGIDQSVQAVRVTEMRLNKQQDLFSEPYTFKFHKYDYETLRNSDAFAFESFIIQQYGGTGNLKQKGDMGIDGKTRAGAPIQVKRSDNIGRNVVDNFYSAIQRFDKGLFDKNKQEGHPVGAIIAFSFSKGAIQEVARLKNEEEVKIDLVLVESIVEIAQKPELKVTYSAIGRDAKGNWDIEFAAKAVSDKIIGFYSWDWAYDVAEKKFMAQVIMDREGVQVKKFEPGFHQIAVKVVDNEGMETVETVKLKVNGQVFLQAETA
jgi:site-specific DNA-methyltransferase (adenine-specific)